jgi:hypothetical protein
MPAEPERAAIVPDHSNWWSGQAGGSERFGYLLWFSVGLAFDAHAPRLLSLWLHRELASWCHGPGRSNVARSRGGEQ